MWRQYVITLCRPGGRVVLLLFLVSWPATRAAAQDAPPQVQGPPVQITVTVTAEEARRKAAAVRAIADHGDPFLAFLAGNVGNLAAIMASSGGSGTTYFIGPLTEREHAIVPLASYLTAHQQADGTIRVQVRRSWTEMEPVVYRFTEGGFLTMVAALVKGPTVQIPALQREQLLWIGRTVLDLSWQAGDIIPHRDVFAALASGFKDRNIGGRLVEIVRAMAESGTRFDLVPKDRLEEFRERAEPGFLVPSRGSPSRIIRLSYDGRPYSIKADELIWSFLRLFSGDRSDDWVEQEATRRRANLGRAVLGYLESQTRMAALGKILETLTPSTSAGEDLALGTYRAQSPGALALKNAPGVASQDVRLDPDAVILRVRAGKVPEFKIWLGKQVTTLRADLERQR